MTILKIILGFVLIILGLCLFTISPYGILLGMIGGWIVGWNGAKLVSES